MMISHRIAFPLLLILSCCYSSLVWGQAVLEETHRELYPFCPNETTTTNGTIPDDTTLNTTRCAPADTNIPLKCTVLADTLNLRELVAVVHHNGISFYHVFPISGNTTLIADYFDPCGDQLVVLGFLEDSVLIASKGSNTSSTNTTGSSNDTSCTPLGVGSILLTDIISPNTTGELTPLTAEPHTDVFEFGNYFLFDQLTGILWVFGVDGDSNRTLVLRVSSGNDTGFNITVLSDSPINLLDNLDASKAILFNRASDNTTFPSNTTETNVTSFIVGPVSQSNVVEVWDVTDFSFPTLAGTINITNPSLFAASSDGTVLYISSGLAFANDTNTTTTEPTDDILLIVDGTDFANLTVVGNITYAEIFDLSGNVSTSANQSHSITALFTSVNYLWIGWNTGELAVWNITDDPLVPVFITFIQTVPLNETDSGLNVTVTKKWGVQDICGSLEDTNKVWITDTEPELLEGDQFNGYILVGPGTGTTGTGVSGGGGGGGGGTFEPTSSFVEPTFSTSSFPSTTPTSETFSTSSSASTAPTATTFATVSTATTASTATTEFSTETTEFSTATTEFSTATTEFSTASTATTAFPTTEPPTTETPTTSAPSTSTPTSTYIP